MPSNFTIVVSKGTNNGRCRNKTVGFLPCLLSFVSISCFVTKAIFPFHLIDLLLFDLLDRPFERSPQLWLHYKKTLIHVYLQVFVQHKKPTTQLCDQHGDCHDHKQENYHFLEGERAEAFSHYLVKVTNIALFTIY